MLVHTHPQTFDYSAFCFGSDTNVEVLARAYHVNDMGTIYSFFAGCFFTVHTYIITEMAFLVNQQKCTKLVLANPAKQWVFGVVF